MLVITTLWAMDRVCMNVCLFVRTRSTNVISLASVFALEFLVRVLKIRWTPLELGH
jgi:hypothetical protein